MGFEIQDNLSKRCLIVLVTGRSSECTCSTRSLYEVRWLKLTYTHPDNSFLSITLPFSHFPFLSVARFDAYSLVWSGYIFFATACA